MLDAQLDAVADLIRQAQRLLFVTGAGISADSGLPTYRGVSGLYNDELCEDGLPIEAMLSGQMFQVRPELTWKHIARIEAACRGATFNRAHEVIAALEAGGKDVWVLTQNVDGLHRRAGSRQVIDIHGDIQDLYCPHCGWAERVPDYAALPMPPRCPDCRQIVRPNVVLFGELLDEEKIQAVRVQTRRGFDLVFSIGTSSLFPYIVAPVIEARDMGVPTVEINPETTTISGSVGHRLPLGAAEAMQALYLRLGPTDTARDG